MNILYLIPVCCVEIKFHVKVLCDFNTGIVLQRNDRSTSPCSSSSGSGTCNSVSGLPSSNQLTPQHLQIVREQMASALVRLRELEEQVFFCL